MEVVSLDKWRHGRQVRDKERELERKIKDLASAHNLCSVRNLLHYSNWLENISHGNPFVHLADGIMYAKANKNYRSYAKSVKHLNLFLKHYPLDQDAVWWRLESATGLAMERHNTYFLSKIAKDAVRLFPTDICILSSVHRAYHFAVQDVREAMKVSIRILELDPYDEQMRGHVNDYRKFLAEHRKLSDIVIFRGGRRDNKGY